MSGLTIVKVNQLPDAQSLVSNTLYIVATADPTQVEFYITDEGTTDVRHLINKQEILALIDSGIQVNNQANLHPFLFLGASNG